MTKGVVPVSRGWLVVGAGQALLSGVPLFANGSLWSRIESFVSSCCAAKLWWLVNDSGGTGCSHPVSGCKLGDRRYGCMTKRFRMIGLESVERLRTVGMAMEIVDAGLWRMVSGWTRCT